MPAQAALVSEVTPGGPAAKVGLRAGDVIVDIDGQKIEGAGDVIDYVSTRTIGDSVTIGYLRGGQRAIAQVVLGELPSADARSTPSAAKLGLVLQTLTPELAESMGLARAGARRGDRRGRAGRARRRAPASSKGRSSSRSIAIRSPAPTPPRQRCKRRAKAAICCGCAAGPARGS